MRWLGLGAHVKNTRNTYNIRVGKAEEKRLIRRPRHRWENNIKVHFVEILWEVCGLFHLSQDRGPL
jgi:hypothetical protein